MGTPVDGMYYSDLAVGEKEDVSPDLVQEVSAQTPYLNTIGFESSEQVYKLAHEYYDDARVDLRNTLNGGISAVATTIILAVAENAPGERVEIQGEIIRLGTNPSGDGVTWVGCIRSVGGLAAAAYLTGTPVINQGKPQPQGTALGDAGVSFEPRLKTAYVQEYTEIIDVPFSAMNMRLHGRDEGNAYDRKVREQMARMKLKLDQDLAKGVAQAAVPSSGTAGAMQGLFEAVYGTNHTACGGSDFTQTILRNMVEDISLYYDPNVDLNAVLLCPIRQLFVFDGWQQAHIEVGPSDPLVQTYGVHVRRLQIGPMMIDCIPYSRMHATGMLYQGQYIKPKVYYPLEHRRLAQTHTSERGLLYGCWTVENNVPEAQGVFSGLRTA